MKNCDSNYGIYVHISKHPDHKIAWEKTTFLDYDRNFYARRMKESLYIDIFSETGTMNLKAGMCKNYCWNVIMPILRKEISEKDQLSKHACALAFLFFLEKFIPTGHISIPRNPRAWYFVEKDLTVG